MRHKYDGLMGMSDHLKRKNGRKTSNKGKKYAKPEWIKTGVPGFDELLVHGIPRGATGVASINREAVSETLLNRMVACFPTLHM